MPAREASPSLLILWSAPRSRSTAFFRMMAERGDFDAVHEPFSYLAEFGRAELGGAPLTTEAELIGRLRERSREHPVFVKDTTDERYPGVLADEDFLARDAEHAFLIRHPSETIASYRRLNPGVERHQIGFEAQHEIFTAVRRLTGREPVVVDAADLVARPEATVASFCARVGIGFRPEALTWRAEQREEWTPSQRWHADAAASTGFRKSGPERGAEDVAAHPVLGDYLRHHLPYYEELHAHRLTV
ncbi:sulfotransferase family protein [Actinomadura graeca]|uniref:Sulfotransferase family protein n=1 Tax=Actinomadura graeca TaxID=2750812 RepID=A0ABX8QUD6_9ACTN|nr:sulfotransferase family protein [Actinomadura graeca]QXJ22400.1 sulfotransferase family protein [Actinomadura graeca]